MEILELMGEQIRKARENAGLSQEDVAFRMGKTQNAISTYETGKRAIRVSELPLLAEILGVSIGYFFGVPVEGEEALIVWNQLNDANKRIALAYLRYLVEVQRIKETESPGAP